VGVGGPAAGPHLRVFVICVDPKTFLRVLPTRWRRKPAGVEITSLSPYVLLDTHRRKSYLIPPSTFEILLFNG